MNIFIWKSQEDMTCSYHDGGGAVAIAETLEKARILLQDDLIRYKEGIPENWAVSTKEPDLVYQLAEDVPEYAEIFPNAGCC